MSQMIRQYDLIEKIQSYNDKADIALLNRAYVFSMKAHGNQRRASGQPYLVHPLEVASILADLKLDDASIAAGLLHDTIEDTLATYDEIKKLFGDEVANLVEGVTKLSKIEFSSKAVEHAENFRKLMMAMSKDIRILLIKLADRYHNMGTLHHISKPEKRKRIAQETMDIYVPLADRIGLYSIKVVLEDLSFRYLEPEEYAKIEKRMAFLTSQSNLVDKVIADLEKHMKDFGIDVTISGRTKTVFSVYRKMVSKNLTFDQLTDTVAYRIVVDKKSDCYEVLGHIHDIYKAIPGRFKDYISNPKLNGYQSLHTSVIGPFGNRMEIQIRTKEMHEVSESGVAAHWLYKQQHEDGKTEGTQYKWVRKLMDTLQNTDDPEEFLENTKLDLFKDSVFIFTPKGDLITLPNGSTPLDFAYDVHSEIGNHCQTAKVNGRVVPLRTRLRNGDQIEIITSKKQKPSPGWREFVVTGKARSGINRFLRSQERDEKIILGKEILEKAAKRDKHAFKEKELAKILSGFNMNSLEDAYVAIAQGSLFPRQIFSVMFPNEEEKEAEVTDLPTNAGEGKKVPPIKAASADTAVGIYGLTPGMSIHIAKCCNPLPGEEIVGIINTGRGITIHSQSCRNLEALSDQPDRFLTVAWGDDATEDKSKVFQARLRVVLNHEPGALSLFTTEIFNKDGNIVDLHIETKSSDNYVLRCDVEVKGLEHFRDIMSGIDKLKCVTSVERVAS
jgi:GTP pyrophosphokinase